MIGAFRQRLRLVEPTKVVGPAGGTELDYENPIRTIELFARKLPSRALREDNDGREVEQAVARFMVWFRSDVHTQMLAVFQGRWYDIDGIDLDNENRTMVLAMRLRPEGPS